MTSKDYFMFKGEIFKDLKDMLDYKSILER